MTNNVFRRIACLVALLALVATPSMTMRPATAAADHPAVMSAQATGPVAQQTGRGWGSFFGCAGCVIGGAFIVAGGPGAIFVAVNTPGSSLALLACVGSCYESLAL